MVPKILTILDKFKEVCRFHGWKTSEAEDWVEAGEEYHSFLWTRNIHLSSFKRIMTSRRCVIRLGLSYQVVDASYVAWLFLEKPSDSIVKTMTESLGFSGRAAIYDLSPMLEGKTVASKMNNTDSLVFKEFEQLLRNEFKLRLKTVESSPVGTSESSEFRIEQMA